MAAVVAGLLALGTTSGARAQQPQTIGTQQPNASGWIFNVAPYLWAPSVTTTTRLNLPPALGGTVSSTSSVGFFDLLSHLNFALMGTAEARYDRFSILTDFLYMNLSGTAATIGSVNFDGHPRIPITAASQAHVGLNSNSKIWTLAGGYTLLKGDWGNIDAIVGFRYLNEPARLDYRLTVSIAGPRGNGAAFGGDGSVSGEVNDWNGIGGVRGRIRLWDSHFFIPYNIDARARQSQLTWQFASACGYHAGGGDLALTPPSLTFQQDKNSAIQRITVDGPQLMAAFTF